MKTNQQLYQERRQRIENAIALKKTDRTPTMAWVDAFAATYKKAPMSRFSNKYLYQSRVILETIKDFPDLDCPEGSFTPPKSVAASLLCKMKLAGKELPEGTLWQVDEKETMKIEDYDAILNRGWKDFLKDYNKRIDFSRWDVLRAAVAGILTDKKFKKAGFPTFLNIVFNIPFDQLCTGRSLSRFMVDLYRMPDKIQAVIDVMFESHLKDLKAQIRQAKPWAVFLGIARGASGGLSPQIWERFVWPYIVKGVNTIVEEGAVANLHFDSNWDRVINRFKELPKARCVWACDSTTDIFKLKKALDGHMCIKGDVPPQLLSVGSPDKIYEYSTRLIKEIGPTGFILAPGCTLPFNAKPENFRAMLAAATGN